MFDPEREWTERDATRERVSRRTCVDCKRHRQNLPPNISLYTIETGEVVCDDCLKRLRRFRRDVDVDLRVDGELDENTREVVRQCFRYLVSRMDGVRDVEVASEDGSAIEILDGPQVEVSAVDATD